MQKISHNITLPFLELANMLFPAVIKDGKTPAPSFPNENSAISPEASLPSETGAVSPEASLPSETGTISPEASLPSETGAISPEASLSGENKKDSPESNFASALTPMPSMPLYPETEDPKEPSGPVNNEARPSACSTSVSANGQLKVIGTQLTNCNGTPIILRGVSTAGIAWFPEFAAPEFMKTLKDEWNISVFRVAMYSYEGNDSYIRNPSWNREKVCSLIDAAIELDLYIIIDWHILADGNPQTYQAEALDFFTFLASTYPNVPNILYEICNEPNGAVRWDDNIKPYANAVIPAIRAYSPNAVIIVGTPTWSQDVDIAAEAPLDYDNLMYALHFYAGTHKEWLQNKADAALAKGLAIFVTEWGTTDASGNGAVDTASSDQWMEYLKARNISWCNWSLCNKAESSALLLPSASGNGTMPDSLLTASGKYVKEKLLQYSNASEHAASPTAIPLPEPSESQEPDPSQGTSENQEPDPSQGTRENQEPDSSQGTNENQEPDSSQGASENQEPNPSQDTNTLPSLSSYNEDRNAKTNTIRLRIRMINDTDYAVSFADLAIRYFYTPESDVIQNFWCDYADVSGSHYRAITESINGSFSSGNQSCMEITFDSAAGTLSPGEIASLQLRISNADWSDYNQENDPSFLPFATSWQENPSISLFRKEE